jgi:hypothetical protein
MSMHTWNQKVNITVWQLVYSITVSKYLNKLIGIAETEKCGIDTCSDIPD